MLLLSVLTQSMSPLTSRHYLIAKSTANSVIPLNCPICQTEILDQDRFALKRCDNCKIWFELRNDELVPLRVKPAYPS